MVEVQLKYAPVCRKEPNTTMKIPMETAKANFIYEILSASLITIMKLFAKSKVVVDLK